MQKVYADATTAMAGVLADGMVIMSGGFGLCGIPEALIAAIKLSGARELTVISNNAGIDGVGLGTLLETRQIRKMISSGIPAFFTKTGVGTIIADGKEVRSFDGEDYVMERGLVADLALVHAWKGDAEGNLVYRKTARNFNPMMATAGKVTIAEVEHLVAVGEIEPDQIHTPGIFVSRLVHVPNPAKHIEQRTVRPRAQMEAV
mgnify:CR=1 FL=1